MKPRSLPVILCCTILTSHVSFAQGLNIRSGANVVMNSNPTLVINNGGINNAGNFAAAGSTVIFSGTANAAASSIGGTNTIAFNNLRLNKTAGNAQLTRTVSVTNTLIMSAGNLDLNGFDLNLGTTGLISGESATSSIVGTSGGYLVRSSVLNAPVAANPGNIGISITSAANPGLTTIRRGHLQPTATGGEGLNRFYEITPVNNSALNATIRFYYLDSELGTLPENQLKIWSSINGGTSWTNLNADAQDVTLNYVEKTGVNTLGLLTLGTALSTLPVHLLSFNGQLTNNVVELTWATSEEYNADYFDVERSVNGLQFRSITRQPATGNANTVTNYRAKDFSPFTATNYYRLKQVDKDGRFTYSQTIAISRKAENSLVSVYPNPASGPINVRFLSSKNMKVSLRITDMAGTVIESKEIVAQKGLNEIVYDLSRLPNALYNIDIQGVDKKVITIIKK